MTLTLFDIVILTIVSISSLFGLGFFLTINFSHNPPLQLEHLQELLNSSTKNTL